MDQSFTFSHPNNYSIAAMECQVSSEYNELKISYATIGVGSSVFLLLDSQYQSFLTNVKSNPQYLPPEYLHTFFYSDYSYKIIMGDTIIQPRDDGYGTVRVLAKRNPTVPIDSISSVRIELLITPQKNDSKSIMIAVLVTGGLLVVVVCGACFTALILYFILKRRRNISDINNGVMTIPIIENKDYQQESI